MMSLKTKNKKFRRLIELKQPLPQQNQVPTVNLTKYVLSTAERSQLALGLNIALSTRGKVNESFLLQT